MSFTGGGGNNLSEKWKNMNIRSGGTHSNHISCQQVYHPASYWTALGILTIYCLWEEANNKERYTKNENKTRKKKGKVCNLKFSYRKIE